MFNLPEKQEVMGYPAYMRKWKTAMQEAYNLASESALHAAEKGKKQSNKRIRSTILAPGDRVLVRNLSPCGGPGKLRAFWEEEIHVVVSRKGPESPVYDIKAESGRGKKRTLHRNLLLPCDYLPPEHGARINEPTKTENSATSKRREKQTETKRQSFASPVRVKTDSDSEEEERPSALPDDLKERDMQKSQHSEKPKGTERNTVTSSEKNRLEDKDEAPQPKNKTAP